MRITSMGHAVFAATLIAIGIWGLVAGDFVAIWQPAPKGLPAREALAYLCATISVACGAGLLWKRTAAWAAGVLLAWMLLWLLLTKARELEPARLAAGSWESLAESVVMVAGAWALYAALARGPATGQAGVRIARILYGLAMLPFGAAHFVYLKLTAPLVPAWLPDHTAWAWFTGAAYIAAGVAILTGVCARLAAALSALQMGLFTLLVWAPILAAGSKSLGDWNEGAVSLALTAAGWVVAETYRDGPWFGRRR
jgi:uncharacterized membrane protein